MIIGFDKVKTLGEKKLGSMKKLLASAFIEDPSQSIDEVIELYTTKDEHFLLTKLVGNRIAGVIAFNIDGHDAHIAYIAVAKKYQRQGVARALINHLIEQNPVSRIILTSPLDTATFFEKVGFKIIDQFMETKRFKFIRKIDRNVYL